MRRFGKNKNTKQNYVRRVGVYGLILYHKKLLLTEQKTFLKNIEVQLPGGGVDPGEQLIPALHREVMEETGWHVCVNQKKGVFERFTYMPEYKIWAHKICHIYSCKAVYRKTSFLEKGHKYIVTDFNFAINRLSDPGFRYFVKKFEKSNF